MASVFLGVSLQHHEFQLGLALVDFMSFPMEIRGMSHGQRPSLTWVW